MENILQLILLFIGHYLADFMFQTRNESILKSRYINYLIIHSLKYSFIMFVFSIFNIKIFLLLFIFHFIIDYIFGNIMSKLELYNKKETSKFLNFLGLNQLLHQILIIILWKTQNVI